MKNLEKFGVLEMNAKEKNEIDGGLFWFAAYAVAAIAFGAIVAATSTEAY